MYLGYSLSLHSAQGTVLICDIELYFYDFSKALLIHLTQPLHHLETHPIKVDWSQVRCLRE